ncbi:MAG: flavodoxin domain-containing protein [Clostridia bacterium]
MNKIIVYASKYGFTGECSEYLSKLIENVEVVKLDKKQLDISPYETVILGTSIYAGQIRPEMKEFIENNKSLLEEKELGIFICGADGDQVDDTLERNFGSLLNSAKEVSRFGYEFDLGKLKFFEKIIVKKIAKVSSNEKKIFEDKIKEFGAKF